MATNSRPSLDVLVPLVMIEDNIMNDDDDNNNDDDDDLTCEPPKEILRHFESGDIVLVRLDSHCVPAIVFNVSGLVMKFDIDRQLYHVCLLNKEFTEQWINSTDMVIYSVPMIVDCQNEEAMLMWSTANEFLEISNNTDDKNRLEEFKKRFNEARHQQVPLSSMNNSRKSRSSRTSTQKPTTTTTQQIILYSPLTACEELHIIDLIYKLSQCTYIEAKRIAEDTYRKILCTNNRENTQSIEIIPEQWFLTFIIRKIDYLRQYSSIWLPDLEIMLDNFENDNQLCSVISLMKQSV